MIFFVLYCPSQSSKNVFILFRLQKEKNPKWVSVGVGKHAGIQEYTDILGNTVPPPCLTMPAYLGSDRGSSDVGGGAVLS